MTPVGPSDASLLLERRLSSQAVAASARSGLTAPAEVVRRLGALQAQDYLGSLWAIALRTAGCTASDVEQALAEGTVVRTWPMRGTLHIVAPENVRWMLELLTPRVIARAATRHAQLGLDSSVIDRAGDVFAAALTERSCLTRAEMMAALEAAGIGTEGQRGYHLLWHHAQRGLICLGPLQAKQQTFVLLEAWVPPAPPLDREEALARLARIYFGGHGPATIDDLSRWAGLTLTEARQAHGSVAGGLERMTAGTDEAEYWFDPELAAKPAAAGEVDLLPPFDEYFLGYRDRRPLLGAHYETYNSAIAKNGVLSATVVLDGRVVGTWKRAVRARKVDVQVSAFEPLARHREAVEAAAARYGAHLGLPAEVAISEPSR